MRRPRRTLTISGGCLPAMIFLFIVALQLSLIGLVVWAVVRLVLEYT